MKHITTADALRALEEAVAEKGEDYVYAFADSDPRASTCMYVYDGVPSCIVGDALYRLGFPLDGFADHEGETIDKVAPRASLPIDFDALEVLYEAQVVQDAGHSWGKALEAARKEASGA